jgi:hypothetical protein
MTIQLNQSNGCKKCYHFHFLAKHAASRTIFTNGDACYCSCHKAGDKKL